ncbi:hypothetical protein [Methylovirgula sp. 4M-Z18]|uniref:hypothetical protein n=1 Tax=Methylovirgula sp. 4M-Z18 TaxID=2293567 RepID=UPI000E2F0C56|nr:hypothetical protein [Methylovirgula sp. 4M-Z18]RFB80007.1 hypothetical protein DYH55_00190 [Methylovirgula sp. 4M-Z18]
MNSALLQTKIAFGYAKAASAVGGLFDLYRPTSSNIPLAPANKIASLPAAFSVHAMGNFDFAKPADDRGPFFHALVDASQIKVGDYLVSEQGGASPYYIAACDALSPPLAVQTNRVVTVWTPGPAHPLGVSYVSGTVAATPANSQVGTANEVALMSVWPASVLYDGRVGGKAMLPEDAGAARWQMLLPACAGVEIRAGSIVTDDLSERYIVTSAQATRFGWRLTAQQAVT